MGRLGWGVKAVIEKLEYLLALAQERHFGRAAERCAVSQPTLSAGVKQLEEQFGVLLVDRGARFRGFTAEGERVLEWARRIVADARAMRSDIDALRRGLSGHLRLAVIPTALPMVSALTEPFCRHHPGVRVTVLSKTSGETVRLLDDLEVDAGVTYLDNERVARVESVPLYQERFRLLTAVDGPLGARQEVGWAELAGQPLCLLTPDMQNRRIIDRILADARVSATPSLESNSLVVLVSHVRTGRWSSVMPERFSEAIGLPKGVRAIPLVAPSVAYLVGLIVPQREPWSPLTAALVAEARRIAPMVERAAPGRPASEPQPTKSL
jgi:DNA-binding transcriptional LysR family regulator